jgi:hypothetical protein
LIAALNRAAYQLSVSVVSFRGIVGENSLATDNWQLTTGNRQLATDNWQQTTGNRQLTTDN